MKMSKSCYLSVRAKAGMSIWVTALITVGLLGGAHAQWSGALGSSWNNPTSASISRMLIDRMNQRMLEKRLAGKKSGAPAATTTTERSLPPPADINAAVRFKSTGTRLKVLAIVKELGGTPAEQEQMRSMLTGILDTWDRESAASGMKNDLGLAFAGFIAMSISAYREEPLPTDEKVRELRDQFAEILASGGGMGPVTDRQKQEMYEVLIIFGTLAYSGWNEAKQMGDVASAAVYKQLGALNLQTVLGIKPESVSFGPDGLSFKTDPAMASPSPAPGNEPRTSSGEAIAAGQLVAEFEGNEVGANMRYGGKRISVFGSVNSIDVENDGRVSLTFRSSINSYGNAKCYFNKSQSAGLARFKTNDQATVTGTVKGYGGGWEGAKAYVILENCIVQ